MRGRAGPAAPQKSQWFNRSLGDGWAGDNGCHPRAIVREHVHRTAVGTAFAGGGASQITISATSPSGHVLALSSRAGGDGHHGAGQQPRVPVRKRHRPGRAAQVRRPEVAALRAAVGAGVPDRRAQRVVGAVLEREVRRAARPGPRRHALCRGAVLVRHNVHAGRHKSRELHQPHTAGRALAQLLHGQHTGLAGLWHNFYAANTQGWPGAKVQAGRATRQTSTCRACTLAPPPPTTLRRSLA